MKFLDTLKLLDGKYKNTKKCIIIGDPIEHSLSPAMHNNGYKSLGIDFIFDRIKVEADELEEFFNDLKTVNEICGSFVGITCTMPHKINIIKYLDNIAEEVKAIKAVNSVFFDGKKYIGYNTDWYGIERPFLERHINLKNKKVAVIGAGGAARSAIYAFKKNNSIVSIFNRTKSKADILADEFEVMSFSLYNTEEIRNNEIIINTTNVGMGDLVGLSPINGNIISKNNIVFDCIYSPKKTKLINDALEAKAEIIYGWEMLLYQGIKQFEIYTGLKPKIEIFRSVL